MLDLYVEWLYSEMTFQNAVHSPAAEVHQPMGLVCIGGPEKLIFQLYGGSQPQAIPAFFAGPGLQIHQNSVFLFPSSQNGGNSWASEFISTWTIGFFWDHQKNRC